MCCLGMFFDWFCEVFIMDEDLFKVVIEVFVKLYEEGFIYCGKCLVNWDLVFYIVVFDFEVLNEEEDGYMWYMCYLFVDGSGELVVVIMCLEIMLGDIVVVVYLDDECY